MLKKHNILVVEDELELAKSTISSLSENGFLPFHEKVKIHFLIKKK